MTLNVRVTDDQLGRYYRKTAAIADRLGKSLAFDDVMDALQRVHDGQFGTGAPNFTHDMRKDGWQLLEDCGFIPAITSVADLEPVSFLRDGEARVNGETMATRAKELKVALGQKQAEYLLEHQGEIPEEFRKYYLVFPGTVWLGSDGYRLVPCLDWDGDKWCLSWIWLDVGFWSSDARLVRPRG